MKRIRIITVGKTKMPHWRAAADLYLKRLSHSCRIEESIVKDADAALTGEEKKRQEGSRLLGQLKAGEILICLDETGKSRSSAEFAAFLGKLYDSGKTVCFMIGGAFGLDAGVIAKAAHVVSLGPMTFPHEMARVVLLEQLYRVEKILSGTGYHH